jgi:hypothetical protein
MDVLGKPPARYISPQEKVGLMLGIEGLKMVEPEEAPDQDKWL